MTFEKATGNYESPRISGECLDCSMPVSFDQYGNCGYNCLYCFSQFQRTLGLAADNYLAKRYKAVSVERFKKTFTDLDNPKNKFAPFIKQRITLQWGGLSDPFCPIEEQDGTGYKILQFLKEIRYPINFSSKSDLILRDKKYHDLFEGMGDVWSYKASIITLDAEKAKLMEAGAPSPQRRVETLHELHRLGIWTIWRMRPFIIGLTSLDYEEQIKTAAEIGCKAISTEFFCLELRSVNSARSKYEAMSKVVGFDIVSYYKSISTTSGYLRLNRAIKEPYYKRMKELCDQYGINLHVSDSMGKEYSASGSCCGLPCDKCGKPSLTNYHQGQFTNALHIAREKGFVTWDDIEPHIIGLESIPALTIHMNLPNHMARKMSGVSLKDYMKNCWNNPNESHSPYKYFKGALTPTGLDSKRNVIYKYVEYKKPI